MTDVAQVLAELPDDAQITVSVRVGDWLRAREAKAGGPDVLTTVQASRSLGYTSEQWRKWAASGQLAGAWQDAEGGPWHLPRVACEDKIRLLRRRGFTASDDKVTPIRARLPRGPRKKAPQAASPQTA